MKNNIILPALLIFIGCTSSASYDQHDLINNDETRSEIFSTIINDQMLLAEFLGQLTDNNVALQQLMMDDEAMQQLFDMQNMHLIAHMKPETMLMLINNLAYVTKSDSSVRSMMMNIPQMQQMLRDQEQIMVRK